MPLRNAGRYTLPMIGERKTKIDTLMRIPVNNSVQWVRIRGNNGKAPLLLHVQAGPGLPIIPESETMERLFHLEEHYLVAYWDQRGCGKSYSSGVDADTISLHQLSKDLISCSEQLLHRYGKQRLTVVGYSIGATIAIIASLEQKSLFECIYAVATDVDIKSANSMALDWAFGRTATMRRMRKLRRKIDSFRGLPMLSAKPFQARARILTDLGGMMVGVGYSRLTRTFVRNLVRSKSYRIIDVMRTIRGLSFCQNALLPDLDTLNLFTSAPTIAVRIHFIHGRHDAVSPHDLARAYYQMVRAEQKSFTTFEHAAHMAHYDEPDKFSALVIADSLRNGEEGTRGEQ